MRANEAAEVRRSCHLTRRSDGHVTSCNVNAPFQPGYIQFDSPPLCKTAEYPETHPNPNLKCHLSSNPLPRLPVHQPHPLKHPLLRLNHILRPALPNIPLVIVEAFNIHNLPICTIPNATRIEFPTPSVLRVPSQVPLERRPATPTRNRATDSPPRRNYDVDTAVDIGVAQLLSCCCRPGLVFGSGRSVGVLPYYLSLIHI